MKKYITLPLLAAFLCYSFLSAQRNYNEFNLIGISGGLTMYNINTDNFNTKQGSSVMGGAQIRGNVYNNFDMLYGISFFDTTFGMAVRETPASTKINYIDMNTQSVQISVLMGYKIIREHLSIEAGPVLNVNGKFKPKNSSYEDYVIDGYSGLTPNDIGDISKVNFHLAAGITAGLRNFRVFAQYQYGVTNTLNKLNDQDLGETEFKGHSSLITFGVTGYF